MTRYRWLFAICLCLAWVPGVSGADPIQTIDPPAPGGGDGEEVSVSDTVWATISASGVFESDDLLLEGTSGQFAAGDPCTNDLVDAYDGFWVPDDDDSASFSVTLDPSSGAGTGSATDVAHQTLGPLSSEIRELSLSPVSPNPSPGEARIAWAVPRESRLRLTIHDVQGRQVAMLANGVYAAGRYSVKWNIRGERGGTPPGIYFVRLQSSDGVLVRRFVLTQNP
jgi:hypothetical protein